jgi:hypothetical protein
MLQIVAIKALAGAALVAALAGGGYLGYSYVKNIGYQEAKVECEERFKEYNDIVLQKIERIESNSSTLVENSKKANEKLSGDINTIMKSVKGKTLTIVKNGECIPSQTFSDTINSVNKRINTEIKK